MNGIYFLFNALLGQYFIYVYGESFSHLIVESFVSINKYLNFYKALTSTLMFVSCLKILCVVYDIRLSLLPCMVLQLVWMLFIVLLVYGCLF